MAVTEIVPDVLPERMCAMCSDSADVTRLRVYCIEAIGENVTLCDDCYAAHLEAS